jgi:hypothetical protein
VITPILRCNTPTASVECPSSVPRFLHRGHHFVHHPCLLSWLNRTPRRRCHYTRGMPTSSTLVLPLRTRHRETSHSKIDRLVSSLLFGYAKARNGILFETMGRCELSNNDCTNEFREEFTTRCTRTGTLSTTDLAPECERGCVWLFKVCRFTSARVLVPSPAMVAPKHRLLNTPHHQCSLFFDQTSCTHPLTRATSPLKALSFS